MSGIRRDLQIPKSINVGEFVSAYIALCAMYLTVLASLTANLMMCSEVPAMTHLRTGLQMATIVILFFTLELSPNVQKIAPFLLMLLLISETIQKYFVVVHQKDEMSRGTGGITPALTFSLFDLTLYQLGLTIITKLYQFYMKVRRRERQEQRSQVAVNKLASSIFEEADASSMSRQGYALVRLGNYSKDGTCLNYNDKEFSVTPMTQVRLLRFNETFANLLRPVDVQQKEIEDHLVQVQQPGSDALLNQTKREKLTQLLLDELMLGLDHAPIIEGEFKLLSGDKIRTFKHQLLAAAAQSKLFGPAKSAAAASQVPSDKSQVILKSMFQSTQKGILKPSTSALDRQIMVKVEVLCEKNAIILVKASKKEKVQMVQQPQESITQIVPQASRVQTSDFLSQYRNQCASKLSMLKKNPKLPAVSLDKMEIDRQPYFRASPVKPMPPSTHYTLESEIASGSNVEEESISVSNASCSRSEDRTNKKRRREEKKKSSSANRRNYKEKEVDVLRAKKAAVDKKNPHHFLSSSLYTATAGYLQQQQQVNKSEEVIVKAKDNFSGNKRSSLGLMKKRQKAKGGGLTQKSIQRIYEVKQHSANLLFSKSEERKLESSRLLINHHYWPIQTVERVRENKIFSPKNKPTLNLQELFRKPKEAARLIKPNFSQAFATKIISNPINNNNSATAAAMTYGNSAAAVERNGSQDLNSKSAGAKGPLSKSIILAASDRGLINSNQAAVEQLDNTTFTGSPTGMSIHTTKSATLLMQEKIKNNRVFVYKIIHDLKHPTQALADGLQKLIQEQTECIESGNKYFLCSKTLKYLGYPRAMVALRYLQRFISDQDKNVGANSPGLAAVFSRNKVVGSLQMRKQSASEKNLNSVFRKSCSNSNQLQSQSSQKLNTQWLTGGSGSGSRQQIAHRVQSHQSLLQQINEYSNFSSMVKPHYSRTLPSQQDLLLKQLSTSMVSRQLKEEEDEDQQSSQQNQQLRQRESDQTYEKFVSQLKQLQQEFHFVPLQAVVTLQIKDNEVRQREQKQQPDELMHDIVGIDPIKMQIEKEESKTNNRSSSQSISAKLDSKKEEHSGRFHSNKSSSQSSLMIEEDDSSSKKQDNSVSVKNNVQSTKQVKNLSDLSLLNFTAAEKINLFQQQNTFPNAAACAPAGGGGNLTRNHLDCQKYPSDINLDRNHQKIENGQRNTSVAGQNHPQKNKRLKSSMIKGNFYIEKTGCKRSKSFTNIQTTGHKDIIEYTSNLALIDENNLKRLHHQNSLTPNNDGKIGKLVTSNSFQEHEISQQSLHSDSQQSNISRFPSSLSKVSPPVRPSQLRQQEKLSSQIVMILNERELLTQIVERQLRRQSILQKKFTSMQGQVEMMASLMRDLLNQAQMANNTFTMVNEYFNCISLVKKCITTMMTQCTLRKVNLVGPILSNPVDKYYFLEVFGDERRYGQIILNFLSNGIKFTPANGTVSVHLSVTSIEDCAAMLNQQSKSSKSGDSCSSSSLSGVQLSAPDKDVIENDDVDEVEVAAPKRSEKIINFQMTFKDTGCGISTENQKRLFMNFSKLHETQNENKDGVGLGLSICKEIITMNGGSIDIKSELNKGTDFIISLQTKCRVDESRIKKASTKILEDGYYDSDLSKNRSAADRHEHGRIVSSSDDDSSYQSLGNSVEPKYIYSQQLSEVSEGTEQDSSNRAKDHMYKKQWGDRSRDSNCRLSKPSHSVRSQKSNCRLSLLSQSLNHSNGAIEEEDEDDAFRKASSCFIGQPHVVFDVNSEKKSVSLDPQNQIDMAYCLLANDNIFLLEAFHQGLSPHFDHVDTVQNGLEAVNAVKTKPISYYKAIVLDIDMPIMNGMKACIEIKKYLGSDDHDNKLAVPNNGIKVQIPFVYALTSESDEEVVRQIRLAGFKAIFNAMNQEMIAQIKDEAGLITPPSSSKQKVIKIKKEQSLVDHNTNQLVSHGSESDQNNSVSSSLQTDKYSGVQSTIESNRSRGPVAQRQLSQDSNNE